MAEIAFSPLLIEEGTATCWPGAAADPEAMAFSPLLIEEGTATISRPRRRLAGSSFQSSTYRGRHCNR